MKELLTGPGQVGLIVLRTLVVYAFILVGFRLSGKREVGQLAPFDFALILLIANAVQNAMVGPDSSLVGGLVAATVLLVANAALGHLAANHRGVEKLLRGQARMLVHRGHIDEHALRTEGISHGELLQALRENGCASIADCRLAVLEVDGTISVIAATAPATRTTRADGS
ncbi:MAG: DUF421 domain-containing protein [Thermoanaerobaculia bacterium]|mgnify:FL=1